MADVFVGQNLLIECEFRLNGVPTDPSIVTVASRSPLGTYVVLTYPNANLIRRSTGLFEASIPASESGTWAFRAVGVGIVDAVNEFTMTVLASGVGA
jgi:hypothetical protein